jgi:predicted RNA-binding protein YlxR (DUF448 family)
MARRRTATPAPDPQNPAGEQPERSAAPSEDKAGAAGLPDPEEKGPLRRCVATRESLPKEAMIRFVLGPDRVLAPDLAGRMPGRGMWLSARGDVLERALTRGAFMKAARGPVHPIPDLRATIVEGLRRRIRDQVGLARRAGQAVVGFQQVREWLQNGRAAVLVEASDGSASERSRLVGSHGVSVVSVLDAAELGAVFGRDHAVHVAVASGRLAQGIRVEAARLAGMLDTSPRSGAAPEKARGERRVRGGNQGGSGATAPASPHGAAAAGPGGAGQAVRPERAGRDGAPRRDARDGAPARALRDEVPRRGAGKQAPDRGASNEAPHRGASNEAPHRGAGNETPHRGVGNEAPHRGGGPASRKDGRQGTRPRRGGEPAVPVTQER